MEHLNRSPAEKASFFEKRNKVVGQFVSGQTPANFSVDPKGWLRLQHRF